MRKDHIKFLNLSPSIDLRSPKEFKKGTIPNSVNLPILNDDEYHEVGKIFRENGRKAAIDYGYRIISGEKKTNLINSWISYIQNNNNCSIFCYRGGLRSKIAHEWINSKGVSVRRLEAGYKEYRQQILLINQDIKNYTEKWLIVGGLTGSGKTDLIKKYKCSIDLEFIANHRGSAFGKTGIDQPSQSNFENLVTAEYLLKQKSTFLLLEDESRFIGKVHLPGKWYDKMQVSEIILLESDLEERARRIYYDYIEEPGNSKLSNIELQSYYLFALNKIRNRLGNNHYKTIKHILKNAFENGDEKLHKMWVGILLEKYYDRMYKYKLGLRKNQIIFRGIEEECIDYISNLISKKN